MTGRWSIQHHHETAGAFHGRPLPEPLTRQVWVCEATAPAVVLGSAQRDEVVDRAACDAAGVEVVRRRSGGGAVLVDPGALVWVDVLVPANDPLWDPDVSRAFLWLGDVWADALADVGVTAEVHRGSLQRSAWSSLVCFAGLGPGELVDDAGRKVVGISQRRTRAGSRFQCAALLRWDVEALLSLLALGSADRAAGASALGGVAAGVGVPPGALRDAFLRRLP